MHEWDLLFGDVRIVSKGPGVGLRASILIGERVTMNSCYICSSENDYQKKMTLMKI